MRSDVAGLSDPEIVNLNRYIIERLCRSTLKQCTRW